MNFENKTVVITGASSGLGLLASKCFIKEGANVAMLATNRSKLIEKVCEVNECGSGTGKAIGISVDVRFYDQIYEACKSAFETFGSIDVVINCAGGSEYRIKEVKPGTEFFDVPIAVYDWGLDVNLKGQFYMGHIAMKYMSRQNSGVIINIGSITGAEGSTTDVAYSTAKSGVMHGLTQSLALVGAPYGIRCCCVSPGPVLTRPAMSKMKTLLCRAAEPEEIVDLILYLSSEKAGFITGVNYLIDGGRLLLKNKL